MLCKRIQLAAATKYTHAQRDGDEVGERVYDLCRTRIFQLAHRSFVLHSLTKEILKAHRRRGTSRQDERKKKGGR
jgi:hypothetical protein